MTDYEKIAADLLPCLFTWCTPDQDERGYHNARCPAYYRPAVAQRMRELVEAVQARLDIALAQSPVDEVEAHFRELEAELAALKAKEAK